MPEFNEPKKPHKNSSIEHRIIDALMSGTPYEDVREVAKVTEAQLISALRSDSFHESLRIRRMASEMWDNNLISNLAPVVMKHLSDCVLERNDVKAANTFLTHYEKLKKLSRQATPFDFLDSTVSPFNGLDFFPVRTPQ